MREVYLQKSDGSGRELEQKGMLRRIEMGYFDVITIHDPELFIGTCVLIDCGSVGIWDKKNLLAGVTHVSFAGLKNPETWYKTLGVETEKLLNLAHSKGGEEFIVSFVNVRTGYRRQQENYVLENEAEEWVNERMKKEKDVISFSWYNGEGFYIDKTNGLVFPFGSSV